MGGSTGELEARCPACRSWGPRSTRRQVFFGEGARTATVMVVQWSSRSLRGGIPCCLQEKLL